MVSGIGKGLVAAGAGLLVMLCVLWCGTVQAREPVRLILHWYPQAQFAGYYMALEKGFYASRGLDVRILPGGPDIAPLDWLAEGRADVATAFLSTALQRWDAGVDLVHIGQVVHDSALMLVARKSDGITRVEDLQGKRVGMWGSDFQIQPRDLFRRKGIQVHVVQQSPSMDLFMRGGLDAVSAMWYNEYHTLMSYGLAPEDMSTFFFRDEELNFPEDALFVLRPTLARPEVIHGMREGTMEGWEYVFAHPDEALAMMLRIMKANGVQANRSHQRWMLDRMRDIILGKRSRIDLSLTCDEFSRMTGILHADGVLQKEPWAETFLWREEQ